MAARIEQLEQRLAAMASSGASTSTSYEEEDFPYLASATQVEASVAVTRGAARALEPRGATGELDPQRAATLCERGSVTATSAEIGETIGEELSSTTPFSDESTWQAAAARMESLPARLIGRGLSVPLMLGKIACISLGVRRSELEPCPFQIQTSLGGTSDRSYRMTRERISVQLRHGHAQDSSQFGVRAVVTSAESYDVLVGGAVLYPMEFRMDYWTETAAYRPGWESGDGRMSELPVRSAEDTPVYEEVEEMVSLAAAVSSSLDVPLWDSCHALQLEADRLVKKAWSEASLPAEAERVSDGRLVCGLSTLSPLVTTPIVWEYSQRVFVCWIFLE
ncbi:hypothetical protein Mp_3g12620 [Marchantia polymorpha subsp. ruderalis]|uniref:Uncharacterized protein n=2 Tax=Marchantia polymorpha TaxID=3197 RepID=A0AAF6B045_MARPO|nr:hypothetical protein MARPO_2991s0001 [Marchantia polymorpha]BBN05379.1 hypothetical protein Mp_3g12620 [Marchantia polymorpha subsp. ruderalis]|eukprot:PTQ26310.1 hypothetical protein MARPO_2991s0001 [Marchantia polymorpha]